MFVTDFSTIAQLADSATPTATTPFDVIVVGGGTSGCVVASRLSENPNISVLLLEAGGSSMTVMDSRLPSSFTRLYDSKHAYQLYTEAQPGANNKSIFWPRGKLLGGCSSINAQMAQYGDPGDFDLWARISGDNAWSWENFSKYFRKMEHYTPDTEHSATDVSTKGTDGPLQIGYFTNWSHSSRLFVKSCISLGIPFSPDFNGSAGSLGVNKMITYVDEKRQRVSSESAYLTPEVLARPNLKVAINATVTRILFDTNGEKARATGVEFASAKDGPKFQAFAANEVILSAGAVHSPHILLLSGVGPAEQLRKHKIEVVHDLPGVGAHLIDHCSVGVFFADKSGTSPYYMAPSSLWDVLKILAAVVQYKLGYWLGYGQLSTNWGEAACFIRSDDETIFPPAEFPRKPKDTKSSPTSPDLEFYTTPMAFGDHGRLPHRSPSYSIQVCLLRPDSHGSITLKSASVWDAPNIDPKYFDSQADVDKMVKGIRLALKLSRTEPLASITDTNAIHPTGKPLDHDRYDATDEELEALVRDRVETIYHPTSTCRMAPLSENGVVDSHLRVYGVLGLRVCDASIFPSIISGHTAGAAFAVGEKGADLIKSRDL